MKAKLTLKLDKDVIEDAKKFAKSRNVSLSRMVERYFKSLVEKNNRKKIDILPWWRSCPVL